ncbi:MAG TPA: alpha/beta hydrolase [Pseudonocardia sp.]
MEETTLDAGPVRYTDTGGSGPVVVLVHGLFVNGSLWRDVLPGLGEHARVVVPELPLGSHPLALRPGTDLTPPGVAALIAEFLAALDLREVTLVGNDTGGAMCQLVAAAHPERLAGLVLTNCDTHRQFLPPAFRYLQLLARVPGGLWLLGQLMRARPVRRLPIAFGWLSATPVDRERADSWAGPVRTDPGVRRDVGAVLRGISTRHTEWAAAELSRFGKPILLAWGRRDRFFRPAQATRLVAEWPDARLEWVEDAATFVPVDAPARLSALVTDFMRAGSSSR